MNRKQAISSSVLALAMAACGTSHLSRGITPEGWVNGDVIHPDKSSATLKEGIFPNAGSLRLVGSGATKDQVYALLGRPHFREGVFGVREWDYIFNFRGTGSQVATCQYKIVFSKEERAASFFPYPEACAPALEDFEVTPQEADRLMGLAGNGNGDARVRAASAAKKLIGLIAISGDDTPVAVREAANELAGLVTSSDVPGWVDVRHAAAELASAIEASGDDTPASVRSAARKLAGVITVTEVPGWVDVRHAVDELASAIEASRGATPAAVREAARKLAGTVTVSEVPGWIDVRHAADKLANAIKASGANTPAPVRQAARELVGVVTISEVPGWVDIRQAATELASAITESRRETPALVRAAARKLAGLVTISEVPGWVDVRHAATQLASAITDSGGETPADVREAADVLVGMIVVEDPYVASVDATRKELSADMLFEFGSDAMTPAGQTTLQELASSIKAANLGTIVIQGHSDRLGAPLANLAISKRRAEAVRRALLDAGVAGAMVTRGYGSSAPKAQCAQQLKGALIACLAPNRRVVVVASQ